MFVTAVNGVSDQAGFSNSILEGSAVTMTLLLKDGMHIFIIITLNYNNEGYIIARYGC